MSGAHVMVVSGKDTSHVVTDGRGEAICRSQYFTDSVVFTVSYIGYGTKREVRRAPRAGTIQSLFIYLVEKIDELTELIVSGESLAVVIRGDTVQFNADAFKTFESDPMSRLFEVLPGMKFEENKLTYLGEPIHRITIDNQRLFGDNIMLALENIRADDVVNIQVYDEASDWDKLNEVKNPQLQRVANVTTKSKPKMVRNLTLNAGGGVALESDDRGERQVLYNGSGKLAYSRVGKSVSATANIGTVPSSSSGEIVLRPSLSPTLSPKYRTADGTFYFDRREANKYSVNSDNRFDITKRGADSWSNREYFSTNNWLSRSYHNLNSSDNRRDNFTSMNRTDFTLRDKSSIRANISFRYNNNINELLNTISAIQDGLLTQSQSIGQWDKEQSYNLNTEINYSKRIKSVLINTRASADISENGGSGWRLDTLSSSTTQIDLDNSIGGWSRNYKGRVSVNFSLTDVFSLSVSDELSYIDSKSKRTSIDILTGITDIVNSHDYRVHEIKNRIWTGITYRNNSKTKGIASASVDIAWENKNMQRSEYFPEVYDFPRTFNVMSGGMSVDYNVTRFNTIKLNYSRIPYLMSILDLRDFLDDSNPVMLRAGNPNLKIPVDNTLKLTGTFIKGASTYELAVQCRAEEHTIVDRSRYFTEDTYLPAYDYTAPAGATLITKENLNGNRYFSVSGDYSIRSRKLMSIIRAGLQYVYSRQPAFVNEQHAMITGNRYLASFTILGNFSSVFRPSLTSNTDYIDRNNGSVRNQSLFQALGIEVRGQILRTIDVNTSHNILWNVRWPDVPGMDRFGFVSNLSLGYMFGQKKNFTLKAEGYDLFNKRQRISVDTEAEYIATSYTREIGRYVMIKAEWKL